MNEPIRSVQLDQSGKFKRMSRFRTDSTIAKKRKKSLIGEVVEVIQSGLDAAFDEIIHDLSSNKII
jgi:predicted methyltransferase